MSAELSIVIVSYNTRELTLACLRSVYEQTKRTNFGLIVVDNSSTDGSVQAIAAEFSDVVLVDRSDNLGFAGANILAVQQTQSEWILLLNPDTVILDGAIDTLMDFAQERPDHGIYGGRTFFADGSLNRTSCWRRSTPWSAMCRGVGLSAVFRNSSLFDPESMGRWRRDTVREVDIVTGCFLLIRRELWEQLGGFHKDFYMYGEEADLCLRAASFGARPIVCPDAKIVHYGGASEKVRADKVVRLLCAKRLLERRHWARRWWTFGDVMRQLWVFRRRFVWGILRWTGTSTAHEKAGVYLNVWRRRPEWLENIGKNRPAPDVAPASSNDQTS